MPILYFLPWVTADEEVTMGNMKLVPYMRGKQPAIHDGIFLSDLDETLGNYGNPTYSEKHHPSPVQEATLVAWNDAPYNPTDEDIQASLQVGQQLAFCALAKRRFNASRDYCNADGYQMRAQRFQTGNGSSTSVATRRRDRDVRNSLNGKTLIPIFLRPLHVDSLIHLDINKNLFNALQGVGDRDLKERLSNSIEMFVLANTDAPSIPERAELVLLRSAFEKVLDVGYLTNKLASGFMVHFKEDLPVTPIWHQGEFNELAWRGRWPDTKDRKITRPLVAWVYDFCAARNDAAHGGSKSKHPNTLWNTRNHLLFGSWLFPLMIKKILASLGLYALTEEDNLYRQGCEKFLAHDLLAWDEEKDESEWSKVESKLHQEARSRKLETRLKVTK
jgi:hypothetical protein